MIDAFRDDYHLSSTQAFSLMVKIDKKSALQNYKHFIRVIVLMANELAFYLHKFELVIVHLRNNLRLPK